MQNNKKRRDKLWWKDPHCHWCGIETVPSRNDSGIQQPNTATLDHLRHKSDPERGQYGRTRTRQVVLACFECNARRGREADIKCRKESL